MLRTFSRILCLLSFCMLPLGAAEMGLSATSMEEAPGDEPEEINSDASLQYKQPGSDEVITLESDEVEVTVEYQPRYTIENDHSREVTDGELVVMAHTIVNRGPRPLLLQLNVTHDTPPGEEPLPVHLHTDLDGDETLDTDEPELTNQVLVSVPRRRKLHVVAQVTVPQGHSATHNETAITLHAREMTTDVVRTRTDTLSMKRTERRLGLFIQKVVSRPEVEVGETVDYTLRVRNITETPATGVQISSTLPVGFTYLPGTLQVENQPMTPTVTPGELTFNIGDVAPGQTVTITYTTQIEAISLTGDGASEAKAVTKTTSSNTTTSKVKVRRGVFDTRGIIVGRVFLDANGNGLLDGEEMGVPSVRLFLEDGTSALTDADGKYSFYGLSSRTHVVKLDNTTLPEGAKIALTSNEQAGDAGSQFASLKYYEMHKTNFALVSESEETRQEIEQRRLALRRPGAEIAREISGRLTTDGLPQQLSDPKALPSSGVVGAGQEDPMATATKSVANAHSATATLAPVAPTADPLAGVHDSEFGFVVLRDGAVMSLAQTDVWVKGPMGARFTLAANGTVIGDDQIGTKATVGDRGIEAWNFVGVNLTPGENKLRATMLDPFGNERGSATITVLAPGELASIKVTPPNRAVADGATLSFVNVELLDARGTLVTARTPLTLETTRGLWRADDLDPGTPGAQVFIEGGRQTFPIMPPLEPGETTLHLSSGAVSSESTMTFVPNLRPMIANGVIEGTLHFGDRGRGAIFPIGARDAFEEELRTLSTSADDGKLTAGMRAAFFLKGKVLGETLLTAAYDSDKAERDRLFRDIQPGEFYPVYGDASERSFDAQSTGRLYVRLDHERSYLLLGDFTTAVSAAGADSAQSLGNYQRSFTGVKEHYETSRLRANVWASQDSTRQVVTEIPTNGTSGPYRFAFSEIVTNSERVELITRDRDQPSRIISSRTLVRFYDYEFEPFSGDLLLRAPSASVDADLNPISLRVTAEIDQGGDKFWVYGGDAHYKLTSRLEVGGGYARDENFDNAAQLASADATYAFTERTKLIGEVARSETDLDGEGWAGRVDLKHEDERLQAHAYLSKTEDAFKNSGSMLLPGRIEGGLRFNYKLTATTSLLAQGLVSETLASGAEVRGMRVDVERAFGAWRVAVGGRHSEQTAPDGASDTVDSVRAKVTAPVPLLAGASVFTEYEREISGQRELAAGGFDYAFRSGGRAYARHEFITSLGGPFELDQNQSRHTTVVGLERAYMKDGQSFSEYRADTEVFGREAEAASGLRNLWKISEGIRANTSFERVTPISGVRNNESTAVTGAIEYAVAPTWRANARLELRSSTSTDSMLNTLGYARLLDRDWTFLGKTILVVTRTKGASSGETIQGRAQFGLAWRPTHLDRWNALGKVESKYENDTRASATFSRRTTQLISGDVNYQPTTNWVFSGHYAAKWVQETRSRYKADVIAHLVGTRAAYTLNRRFDVALNAHTLVSENLKDGTYAVGPEVGVVVAKNLNIGIGYNIAGFRDHDFSADGSTVKGFFVRLRLKFDENSIPGRKEASAR